MNKFHDAENDGENEGGSGIQVIDRSAQLLAALAAEPDGASLTALAQATGLNTATCHRILAALAHHGFVARVAGGRRYQLGLGFFVLGSRAAGGTGLKQACAPALLRLRAETGASVFLMARQGFHIVCIDRVDGDTLLQTLSGRVGGTVPLGVGPGSQAILAFLPHAEQDLILRRNAPGFAQYQNHSFRGVEEALRETRQRGYALDLGGIIPGSAGIAVPLRAAGRPDPVASIGLGLLTTGLDHQRLPQLAALLLREAAALQAGLNPLAG